jgi:hypothetical protein
MKKDYVQLVWVKIYANILIQTILVTNVLGHSIIHITNNNWKIT